MSWKSIKNMTLAEKAQEMMRAEEYQNRKQYPDPLSKCHGEPLTIRKRTLCPKCGSKYTLNLMDEALFCKTCHYEEGEIAGMWRGWIEDMKARQRGQQ